MALANELTEIALSDAPFVSSDFGRRGPAPLVGLSEIERLGLLAEFGVDAPSPFVYGAAVDPFDERREVLRTLVGYVPATLSGTAVFTDHTTLAAARSLIAEGQSNSLSAGSLLDLDTFVRSAVLFDQIVCLENPESRSPAAINQALGEEVVHSVPAGLGPPPEMRGGRVGAFSDLFDDVRSDLSYNTRGAPGTAEGDDMAAIFAAWELVTGRPITKEELLEALSERRHTFASATYWNLQQMASAQTGESSADLLNEWPTFVDESNLRALFNMRVAELLQLPYAPNTSRLPMHYHLFRNAIVGHDQFLDIEEIQRAVNERTLQYTRPKTVSLPVFLTVALAKASRPTDLWEEIATLRRKAAPYRAHRNELLDALRRGDGRAIDRLNAAVASDMDSWRKVFSPAVVLGIVAELLTTGAGWAAAIITSRKVLKVGAELDSGTRQAFIRRVTRPDEWFLTQIGDTASRLVNALVQVEHVWKPTPGSLEFCARRLAQIRTIDRLWPAETAGR